MSRIGVKGFLSGRLSQILDVRRLTQAQLASLVGVSTGTVSKWKNGSQTPEPDALGRLSSVLNVEPEWFSRPIVSQLSKPLFRSNASAHTAARKMLGSRMEWLEEVAYTFSEYVDFPVLNLPSFHFQNAELITAQDIEEAADQFRALSRLGRGPIQDLMLAVEGAGVLVVREETGTAKIEGLSAWSEALSRPLILLSADKDNCYRSRFDLAHELGHLILHRFIVNASDKEVHNELERQAHYFAGALLLPAETIASDISCNTVTLDDLILLKKRYGVSVAALIMRLSGLNIISEHEKTNLFKRLSARWGRKSEPGDKDRIPEKPRLLKRTVDLLADEGVMPLDCMPRHVGISEFDLANLIGVSPGYFTNVSPVVQLAKLRGTPTVNKQQDVVGGNVVNFPPLK